MAKQDLMREALETALKDKAELLAALRKIAEFQREACMRADSDMLFMVLDNKVDIALAAIAKVSESRLSPDLAPEDFRGG